MIGRIRSLVDTVIGVVLMLWVTVLLGVIILMFILGIGKEVEENPTAAVRFDNTDAKIKLVKSYWGRDFLWLPDDAPEGLLERDDVRVYSADLFDEIREELGGEKPPGER